MNRQLVLAEWKRARKSLRAAEILTREGYSEDALSRAYYAVLHTAKAALWVKDVATVSHAGVRPMFGLHLIRPGEIEPEWATYIGETLDDRLAADYNVNVSVTLREARENCRRSRRFLSRIRRYLLDKGLTEAELRRRRPDA